jgi:cytidylate kinase
MVVTISNEYGAGALAIAARVAGLLDYEYVDRQLPVVVAKRLSISPEEVDANEDTGRTLGERLLAGLERATPELAEASSAPPFDQELVAAVAGAIQEYAARDNAVIVGRGGALVLGRNPNVLRVFMHAPLEWRIAHVAQAYDIDAKAARAEVESVDRMRAAFVRQWYDTAFGDPSCYDLTFDTSRFEPEAAAGLIVAAVRLRGSAAR